MAAHGQSDTPAAPSDSLYNVPTDNRQAAPSDTTAVHTLSEVVIRGARVVRKPDGQLFFPSEKQLQASTNGYNLLARLALPRIRVDEVARTITPLTNTGTVQLRLNGAITTREELIALDPKTIRSVDFIDNPGVRYGEGIGYVIDIRTRRIDSGWQMGTNFSNTLTTRNGNNTVFGKLNRGNSELGLTYSQSYQDFKGDSYSETADYLLNNGTRYQVRRNTEEARRRDYDNTLQAKYNLADSASYVFQAVLTGGWQHQLNDDETRKMTDSRGKNAWSTLRKHETTLTPTLDLYFMHTLGSHQTLTANVVGTRIGTDRYSFNDEGTPYEYATKGRTWSVLSEAVYENRLRPFTVSLGWKQSTKYTRNEYSGAVSSLNRLHNNSLYLFGEIKGNWRSLSYVAGLGASRHGYRQADARYTYWLFRPKATLSYAFSSALSLRYVFEMYEHISQIAFINNTVIRTNAMEWTVGNPSINPNKVFAHTLTLAYNRPGRSLWADLHYRTDPRPNMAHYERTPDDRFIYTQRNQKDIRVVYAFSGGHIDILPDRLAADFSAGIFRCFNYGDNYRHHRTSFICSGSLNAYLGRWTLTAAADNGWKFMEGETRGDNGGASYVGATYRIGNCDLSLFFQHPFEQHPRMYATRICNEYLQKSILQRGRNYGHMLTFNLTWKLQRGRKYRDIHKTLRNKDSQSGIL